ncbi:MAG: hypothetical protein HWE15_07380 [Algoriphagus sp.]|nr:hypothetical protein [Algoriphagus sp.]
MKKLRNQLSQFLILGILSLLLFACDSKLDAGAVNLENWKADRDGCKGLRLQDLDELEKIKNNFLGASNQALIKTFGRPDRVELVDKSQSFFFYYLEPSSDCEGVESEKEPLKVLFRMNALSKVSEVTITDLNP